MKPWYFSKTLWLNGISLALVIVQALQGQPWFAPEAQAGILAVLNAALRFLTSQPVGGTPNA